MSTAPEEVLTQNDKLEDYLFKRGLIDPATLLNITIAKKDTDLRTLVINDDTKLKNVGNAWTNSEKGIKEVIKVRILALAYSLVCKDIPQEVPVSRQAILELVQVLNDFEHYHAEFIRRNQKEAEDKEKPEGIEKANL